MHGRPITSRGSRGATPRSFPLTSSISSSCDLMTLVRIFWPSDLCKHEARGLVPLCGFYATSTVCSHTKIVNVVVIGPVCTSSVSQRDVCISSGHIQGLLADIKLAPAIDGWQAQLCCLGCWKPNWPLGEPSNDHEACPVWLDTRNLAFQFTATGRASFDATLPHVDLHHSRVGEVTACQVRGATQKF
jgi:hypothetical protein